MPGIDKPTGRVVVLIVLLIVAGSALRGYLPARDGARLADAVGSGPAWVIIVVALAATLTLMAVALVVRLLDPRAVAPNAGDISELLDDGRGEERPSWRVVLISVAVLAAWLLIVVLLARTFVPHDVSLPAPTVDSPAESAVPDTVTSPGPPPRDDSGDAFGILLVSAVVTLLMITAGAVIVARRRGTTARRAAVDQHVGAAGSATRSESLMRAAELGLAEMADWRREAIIACYSAMERELANFPEAAPQEFDTPTEVLARAVEHQALRGDNAVQLVDLFAEARFSPHVMNEDHREVAVRVLRLVLDELASRSGDGSVFGGTA